jgi:hypothetical protein
VYRKEDERAQASVRVRGRWCLVNPITATAYKMVDVRLKWAWPLPY